MNERREKKELVVDGRYRVPYDHLVLCTGTQYAVPRQLQRMAIERDEQQAAAEIGRRNGRQKDLFKPKAQGYACPANVLLVNDHHDSLLALSAVEQAALRASVKNPGTALYCTAFYSTCSSCNQCALQYRYEAELIYYVFAQPNCWCTGKRWTHTAPSTSCFR